MGGGGPGASATVPAEYMPYFQEASQKTGIPVDLLIAQARQESGFNPNARGGAGEIGMFQIKPSTASDPGGGVQGVDPATLAGPGNVRNNILFGAQYLKSRMQGDPANPAVQVAGLRAYNGGGDPNYVQNVFRYRPAPAQPGATTASAAPAAAPNAAPAVPGAVPPAGTPAPYQVASNAPVAPPGSSTAAPAPPLAPTQPPASPVQPTTVAPSGLPQPPQAPAPIPLPPPPQPPATNANGLTDQQQRQIDALGASGQMTVQQRAAAEQAYRNQNIQQRQQSFSDYMTQQTLVVAQNNSATQKYEADIKAWQAAHPDLAPGARENTVAFRTLQELAPIVRAGNAPQDVIDRYNNAATAYQEFKTETDPITKAIVQVPTRPLPPDFPQPGGGSGQARPVACGPLCHPARAHGAAGGRKRNSRRGLRDHRQKVLRRAANASAWHVGECQQSGRSSQSQSR